MPARGLHQTHETNSMHRGPLNEYAVTCSNCTPICYPQICKLKQYIAIPLLLVAFRGVVQMSVSGSSQEICDTVCDIRKSSPQLFKYNPRSNHVTLERASWFCTFFRSKIIAHFCQLTRWTTKETHGKLLIGLKQSTKHIQILMFVLKKQTNNCCRWGRTLGS